MKIIYIYSFVHLTGYLVVRPASSICTPNCKINAQLTPSKTRSGYMLSSKNMKQNKARSPPTSPGFDPEVEGFENTKGLLGIWTTR